MSYDYKKRLDDYLSGDPTQNTTENQDENITYFDERYTGVRNVCFVLLNGKHMFLNYNYLISGEYFPEENRITLQFTTNTVTLEGYNLKPLYQSFIEHSPKIVIRIDGRYENILQSDNSVVIKIDIDK